MEALRRNHGRYNMMQSTILDMLAIIWKEQIKPLLIYLGDSYKETLEDITDSEVGSNLLLRCVGSCTGELFCVEAEAGTQYSPPILTHVFTLPRCSYDQLMEGPTQTEDTEAIAEQEYALAPMCRRWGATPTSV
jgi:hypothetical protein